MKRSYENPSSSSKHPQQRNSSRSHFNQLCSNLTSIIPPQHFQNSVDMLCQADKIEKATSYIVDLRERVENLNKRKEQLMIEVKDLGSVIEVQLVVQQDRDIKLHEVIRVLEEEGAEVVNATFSTSGNYILHTLHARARNTRIGIGTSRVQERLHELI
ncbi:transcription factor bHLH168-like [Chenopodium quinoa]|uniref:transcription factor bHLH168-like n=1 Tax=Chenopodium quinoa TaxID=63459 RepID=UPI000B76CAC4|nr:transcription factor bHLH168-like [Chenopodium quinoa]